MNNNIPIDDSMPENLKNAINYLNEKNISLDDKINVDDVFLEDDDDDEEGIDTFNGVIDTEDLDDSENDEDDIYEADVDLSDLDSMF